MPRASAGPCPEACGGSASKFLELFLGRLARRPKIVFLLDFLQRLCMLGALQGARKRSRNLLGSAAPRRASLDRPLRHGADPR